MKKCINCGTDIEDAALFCPECGAKQISESVFCPNCGTQLPSGAAFCSECGAPINAETPAAAPVAVSGEFSVENLIKSRQQEYANVQQKAIEEERVRLAEETARKAEEQARKEEEERIKREEDERKKTEAKAKREEAKRQKEEAERIRKEEEAARLAEEIARKNEITARQKEESSKIEQSLAGSLSWKPIYVNPFALADYRGGISFAVYQDTLYIKGYTCMPDTGFKWDGIIKDSSKIKKVVFLWGVKSVCLRGLSGISDVVLPISIVGIENWGFEGCTALKTVTSEYPLMFIGFNAFADCTHLEDINISKDTKLDDCAFYGCDALSNSIKGIIKGINPAAFESYKVKSSSSSKFHFAIKEYRGKIDEEAKHEAEEQARKEEEESRKSKEDEKNKKKNLPKNDTDKAPKENLRHEQAPKPESKTKSEEPAKPDPKPSTMEYVDLGLSVKWAKCNLGAKDPEEIGDYYAWGELAPKQEYARSNYKYLDKGLVIKYNTSSKYGNAVDNIKQLDLSDDAAHQILGGGWRMPTMKEVDELKANCSISKTTINGIKGYRIKSKKKGYTDNWVFLPASGYRDDELNSPSDFYYWTSSLYTRRPDCGQKFFMDDYHEDRIERFYGLTIRPVMK